jgi:hypothetical protein
MEYEQREEELTEEERLYELENNIEARRAYRAYELQLHKEDPEKWPLFDKRFNGKSVTTRKGERSSITGARQERKKREEQLQKVIHKQKKSSKTDSVTLSAHDTILQPNQWLSLLK